MSFENIQKLIAKNKQKEFNKKAEAFIKEYDQLVEKHKCSWKACLKFLDGGGGIIPALTIVDVSGELKEIDKDEDKRGV